ncbi:MAG TPA: glutamate synthase, partial [Elusimicrobia bacterium]|nr:glutamate synthase [Elusimicrobiota bacterium]
RITEDEKHNPILRIERQEGTSAPEEVKHDLVVLSQGLIPGCDVSSFHLGAELNDFGFVKLSDENISSAVTAGAGVFAAGVVKGPRDIPDSVVDAGSAAIEAANYIRKL